MHFELPATTGNLPPKLLILGTADWNQPIATNQHYMARELAQDFDVQFVESMGLRKVELSGRDVSRIFRRLFRARPRASKQRIIPANLSVVRPVTVPRHTGVAARVNERLVRSLASSWLSHPGPRILWTYTPVTYGLEKYATSSYYHCVDLLGALPGISSDLIDHHEYLLAKNGVAAIASSDTVKSHLEAAGFKEPILWPNVADVSEIISASRIEPLQREQAAVFAGNFTTHKVDFALLNRIVENGVTLHLAGPVSEGGGNANREMQTLIRKGAKYHGLLTLEQLAQLYARCTVGVIPYLINQYTLGVNPLKTYEYLAAGLAVVSTDVPAVSAQDGDILIARTQNTFLEAVRGNLEAPDKTTTQRRLSTACENSWLQRGNEARALIWRDID